ncbi:hypothetical protein T08_8719 [Trichinella sp. T8]|nr:hypothetical protein T08_8719 [Trichinella sp. T8]
MAAEIVLSLQGCEFQVPKMVSTGIEAASTFGFFKGADREDVNFHTESSISTVEAPWTEMIIFLVSAGWSKLLIKLYAPTDLLALVVVQLLLMVDDVVQQATELLVFFLINLLRECGITKRRRSDIVWFGTGIHLPYDNDKAKEHIPLELTFNITTPPKR